MESEFQQGHPDYGLENGLDRTSLEAECITGKHFKSF